MKIYIGSDHAGFELKKYIESFLKENDYEVFDCGPDKYDPQDDYPDYISIVARYVSKDLESRGIVIGYSGQGEAIVSNRFSSVRCAVYYGGQEEILTLSRKHNDANVLSLSSHFLSYEQANQAILLWLKTEFSGDERHVRRIKKIEDYDNA